MSLCFNITQAHSQFYFTRIGKHHLIIHHDTENDDVRESKVEKTKPLQMENWMLYYVVLSNKYPF